MVAAIPFSLKAPEMAQCYEGSPYRGSPRRMKGAQ